MIALNFSYKIVKFVYFYFISCALFEFGNSFKLPLVIGTWGTNEFKLSVQKAWESLAAKNSRLNSLVTGLSECEKLQCDFTVGWGGSPDELGETTLDSLIMDGPEHRVGAVGALRRIKNAAHVAWAVMNYTKHSLLVGEKATQFAISLGFKETKLDSNYSRNLHNIWLKKNCQPNFWKNVLPNAKQFCGPYKPNIIKKSNFTPQKDKLFNTKYHDTLGMIVIDETGNISAGTTSNGATFKIPGRIGDSPIPGSGAYVDNDIGAAVSTGDGDIMMRFSPSFLAVELMRSVNASPQQATQESIMRIKRFHPNFFGAIVAANYRGEYGASCSGMSTFKFSLNNSPLNLKGKTIVKSVNCL